MHGAEQLTGVSSLAISGSKLCRSAGAISGIHEQTAHVLAFATVGLHLVSSNRFPVGIKGEVRGLGKGVFGVCLHNCVLHIDEHIGAIGILADADVGVLIDGGAGNHLGVIGPFGLEQITIH